MNKLLIATIIFFASYAGTVGAVAFLARSMWAAAAVSYCLGWAGWGIAFLIGGNELVKKRRYYRKVLKKAVKQLFKR